MSLRDSPFAACTFITPGQSFEKGLSDVCALGVQVADFGVGSHVAHEPLADVLANPKTRGRAFAKAAQEAGISLGQAVLVDFGPPTNTPDRIQRELINENLPRLLEFLVEARSTSLMVTAGPLHAGLSWEECFRLAVDGLSRYTMLSEKSGVHICLEPDVDSFMRNPSDVLALLEAVPGLRLTLDLSHFICRSVPQRDIERLFPYTHLLHVRQASPGMIVDHWDAGTIDFRRLIRNLEAVGFDGEYCVEYLGVKPTLDCGIDPFLENAKALADLRNILTTEQSLAFSS